MTENQKNKYSYQECWNYAFLMGADINQTEVKNNIISLCQTNPENFWLNFSNKSLSVVDYSQICHDLSKYLKENYPVPYLTKQVRFFGLDFAVKKGVFIPQPDTEVLVEKVLELASKYWEKEKQLKVLDIGTGCGNIAISLAKNKLNWSFIAVDINDQALAVAKKNSITQCAKNIKFVHSDLFGNLNQEEKFSIIVSNPPYVSITEYHNLSPIVKTQPVEALVAENDGYFFYQKIFQQVHNFLEEKFLVVVEIGHQQTEKVVKLIIEHFPKVEVSIFFDYEGRSRVISIYQSSRFGSSVG